MYQFDSVTAGERVVPEVVAQILAGRGIEAAGMERFLWPEYERDAHDPWLLGDMEPAVARIAQAVANGERVVVYGDYDIDGITASAVMLESLRALGIAAESYIPDRFEEGYGINQPALEQLQAAGADLVVSVDCGITSVNEAAWARAHGLDLIITDHHAAPEVLPEAVAVINPKRPGDAYPFKELAGVGVAFKLVQALQSRLGKPVAGQEKWLLDLVALGTVCDVVPLVGENRMLATYGLKVLRRTRRPGILALAAVAGTDPEQFDTEALGFRLGPRMNAAGRLEHAAGSLELVMTGDAVRARELANGLDQLNRERRKTQEAISVAALEAAGQYADDPVVVLAAADWSHGVVGIVASRLVEKLGKPVLVAQILGSEVKGSARSTGAFNMVEALRANAGILSRFGGHYYAAGFTLPGDRLDDFRASLNAYFRESGAGDYATPEVAGELVFRELSEIDWQLLADFELLQPYGRENPAPLLELKQVTALKVSRIGSGGQHVRLVVADHNGRRLNVIGFGLSERCGGLKEGQSLTLIGRLNKNEFQGTSSLQFVAEHIFYE